MKFVVCVKQMRDEICCVRERIRDEFLAVVFGCVKKGVKESLKKRVKKIGRKHSKYRCNQTIHFSFCFHAFLSRTPFYPPCLPTIRVPFLPRPLAKKKTTLFIFGDTRIRKKIKNIPGTFLKNNMFYKYQKLEFENVDVFGQDARRESCMSAYFCMKWTFGNLESLNLLNFETKKL